MTTTGTTTALVHEGARLIDAADGEELGGARLAAAIGAVAERIDALPPGVLFARTALDVPSVLRFLGAFTAARPIALIDPAVDDEVLVDLLTRFRPVAVLGAKDSASESAQPPAGYRVGDVAGHAWLRTAEDGVRPHPDLAVLLPTSGSTGNPKLVRLSRNAILHNADAIAQVLGIDGDEVAPTSLPLHYSYGLSVLNSHMVRGATVVVEGSGVMARSFWRAVEDHKATSFAGVPYHYEMLRRLRFDPVKYPSLRTLTQAGGRLGNELIAEFNEKMRAVGGRMFVMYGQTEAAPRMATVPAERLTDKLGSAGLALPGGAFAVRREDGSETRHPGIGGEVIYRGPNVMMGYAEEEAQLADGDELGGVLATGDLGHLDQEGFLFLTGRMKRIGKVFGNRINLDDVEHLLRESDLGISVAAAVPGGDKVIVWLEGADKQACRAAARELSERVHLHASGFDVRGIDVVPLLASGKIDYRSLEEGA